jgi:ATP-dependent helicase/nuclease subunit B
LKAAAEWIQPLLGQSEILIIGATRAAADEFVRSLPVTGTLGLHRLTFPRLAAALAHGPMNEQGMAPATALAMEAVCARALYQARREGELCYFTPVAKAPGFPAALARTVRDLRLAGVRPAELRSSPAAADIGRLLELCENELNARKLVDLASILELAAGVTSHPYLGLPALLLDVPLPSRAHLNLLRKLAKDSSAMCAVTVSSDERVLDAPVRDVNADDARAIHCVRHHLFAAEPPAPTEYDESVDLFSAPGESLESVEIARRVHAHASNGIPFDRIAILLRQPDRYQPLIEEALRRAEIPAYFSRGTTRPAPAGRAFLALLACASEGCSASRFAEYMSLGQLPQLDERGAPPRREPLTIAAEDELFIAAEGAGTAREQAAVTTIATPLAWEKLLVDAAVIGGYERWARRLRGLENEFRIQLGALGGEQQDERERLERELERLGNLERFALPLIEDLHSLPQRAHWGEWLDALSLLAARALSDPEPVESVLAELEPMSDVGPVEIGEVQAVLSDRLRFLRREPLHRRYGCVFVGSIDEARGRVFDVVFLPGLAEGLFPQRAFEDPLLLDDLRRTISDSLHTRSSRAADERLLLRTAAASAESRFIASYPSMDLGQGRPRVPSFYALEIARAIEGRVPPLRQFETRLSANSEARLVWPAPRDPLHAIDDAEYDLAWLAAHYDETGSARYLVDANAHLGRSLRARWKRWEKKWTDADGFVHPDAATRSLLEERRLTARDYSPSALQNYSLCPYRFVLSGILHLRERQEPAAIEQLDPLTRGAIVHEVQREFLRWWKRERATDTDVLLVQLDEVLIATADNYAERIAPAIPRVWHSEIEDIRTDLRGWLMEWFRQTAEWDPLYFELAFGLQEDFDAHDSASRKEAVQLDGVRVRGSIDLVERHRQSGALRITDYKTGRALEDAPTSIAGGRVLQPVLYSLAAEQMLGANAETARLWYCTQRGNYGEHTVPIDAAGRARFQRAMALIDDAIAEGFLPAAPAEHACATCDYRPVCGPNEEVRVRRWKHPDDLDLLNQLRSLP